MAAFGAEQWQSELPNHDIFKLIREKLDLDSKGDEKRVTKNLAFCLGGDLFVWDDGERVFYTTNLRQLNSAESQSSGKFQTLLSTPPPFPSMLQRACGPPSMFSTLQII
uniref:Uncharacterized protein n=1 Tax=Oryzias melastigma TaxID=30732 RepID=A0A3B3CWI7_ORYME